MVLKQHNLVLHFILLDPEGPLSAGAAFSPALEQEESLFLALLPLKVLILCFSITSVLKSSKLQNDIRKKHAKMGLGTNTLI